MGRARDLKTKAWSSKVKGPLYERRQWSGIGRKKEMKVLSKENIL